MKFRRKSAEPVEGEVTDVTEVDQESVTVDELATGPYDADTLVDDVPRLDLGSLLIEPTPGLELRLQVDESTEEVQAVVLAGDEGAVELRAFAAPRGGDLWSDLRPKIASDYVDHGGTVTERDGRFGTELVCELTVHLEDGRTGVQPSRVIGINGERWMLRATLLGRAAQDIDAAAPWEDAIKRVVVRRGSHAMPVGAELPLTLPPREQLAEPSDA